MSEATRILAIRHGETDWNRVARIQGHTDIALNEAGRQQASRLADALRDEPIAAVYTSDLSRALETAGAFALPRGLPLHIEPRLRERCFGCFEGLTFDEIGARWPDQLLRWKRRDPDFGPDGGEALGDFYARVIGCINALVASHPGQQIALVAHGGVLDCLYRAATRLPLDAPRTWQVANAGINRLMHAESGLMLVGWADNAHLDDPSLPRAG